MRIASVGGQMHRTSIDSRQSVLCLRPAGRSTSIYARGAPEIHRLNDSTRSCQGRIFRHYFSSTWLNWCRRQIDAGPGV